MLSSLGSPAMIRGMAFLTLSTISSVDALPFLSTVSSAARAPLCRTMLLWTAIAVPHLGHVLEEISSPRQRS